MYRYRSYQRKILTMFHTFMHSPTSHHNHIYCIVSRGTPDQCPRAAHNLADSRCTTNCWGISGSWWHSWRIRSTMRNRLRMRIYRSPWFRNIHLWIIITNWRNCIKLIILSKESSVFIKIYTVLWKCDFRILLVLRF